MSTETKAIELLRNVRDKAHRDLEHLIQQAKGVHAAIEQARAKVEMADEMVRVAEEITNPNPSPTTI